MKKMLNDISLPELKSREEMLEILQKEEYGYLPDKPEKVEFESTLLRGDHYCMAGKADMYSLKIKSVINGKDFVFPASLVIPKKEGTFPFFVHIAFSNHVPDRYMPTEEIIDNGFAVLSFCYEDVTKDNPDFSDGLAGILYPGGKCSQTDAGKLAMWAWAAHRMMDYAETDSRLDSTKSCVCGHSRLGKTALLAGATDTRFAVSWSNDSGCSGAAITRNKQGEDVYEITQRFPYWFCENYFKYRHNEQNMPFDQHFLLASIAPRKVYVSSAEEDVWADPVSEFLCCVASGAAFENGFIHEECLPATGELFHRGDIGYHVRKGAHFMSRDDWKCVMEYLTK